MIRRAEVEGGVRSEVGRGEWKRFTDELFTIVPMGSVAYKLALVAAGRADATWTLVPKHEWDVAAGAALARASGGWIALPDGAPPTWNNPDPLIPGLGVPGHQVGVTRLVGGPPMALWLR